MSEGGRYYLIQKEVYMKLKPNLHRFQIKNRNKNMEGHDMQYILV